MIIIKLIINLICNVRLLQLFV